MSKRIVSGIMVFTLLLSFLMLPANAADMKSRKVADTVLFASTESAPWCQAVSLRDDTNQAQSFSYDVPENGVTILIFSLADTLYGSAIVRAFAQSQWAGNDKLNVILLDCSYASKEGVQNFLDSCLGENQRYFNVYYGGNLNQLFKAYQQLLNVDSEIPLVVFITEENGKKMVQKTLKGRYYEGLYFSNMYSQIIAELLDKTDDGSAESNRRHLEDTAITQRPEKTVYKGFALSDDTDTLREFSYSVPKNGVTFLIFFQTSCTYSALAFQGISESEWAKSPNVNIIAVEISGADKESVRSFVNANRGRTAANDGSQDDLFEVYYYPGQSSNSVASMAFNYAQLLNGKTQIGTPFCLLIQEENGHHYIMRDSFSVYEAETFANAIASLTDIGWEDSSQAVKVKTPGRKNYGFSSQVVSLVNEERSKAGLAPLRQAEFLTGDAMTRATEIALFYSHTRPNGEIFSSDLNFRHQLEYQNVSVGENIACGYANPREVVDAWMSSAGHRANILNPDYAEMGAGSFTNGGTVYWVQIFSGNRQLPEPEITYDATDVEEGNYTVSISKRHLHTVISGLSSPAALRIGQSVDVRLININEGNGEYAVLLPSVSTFTPNDKAALSAPNTQGILTLTPLAEGNGTLELKAYDEDASPASVFVNVSATSAPVSIANVSRREHSVTATIFCENTSALVFCSIYSAEGQTLSIRSQTIMKSGNYEFLFDDTDFYKANVMIFDIYRRIPLCKNAYSF